MAKENALLGVVTIASIALFIWLLVLTIFFGIRDTAYIKSVSGTDGITVVTSALLASTVSETLTTQTALADTNAFGPLVAYDVLVGGFQPIAENTWRTAPIAGFPIVFFPGSSDDGQGNVGGTGWTVPVVGIYSLTADCEIFPSAYATDDLQTASVALSLGATSEDPLAAGYIPYGSYATISLSVGTNGSTAPALAPRVSVSGTFQAGCTACPVGVGDSLTVHARTDHTGSHPAVTATVLCRVQVSRLR